MSTSFINARSILLIATLCLLILQGCDQAPANTEITPQALHIWSGAPDTSSIVLGVWLDTIADVHFVLGTGSLFEANVVHSEKIQTSAPSHYAKVRVNSLLPGTRYHYAAFIGEQQVSKAATFQTFAVGPQNFSFVHASCMRTGSTSPLFETMAKRDPLFFLQTGDYHYENIADTCSPKYLRAYQANWGSAVQASLTGKAPFIYMWDDHDYGPNNSAANAPCREEAVAAYTSYVPHYPLAFEESKGPVSQSFSVGRLHFVLSDLRSQKLRPTYRGCDRLSEGSNFGTDAHMDWFFEELLSAKSRGQMVVWVSGMPFINHPGGPNYDCDENDDWGGYPEERQRIADFVKANDISICILSGDAHMSAIDDGSNSDYATGGGAPIPVFHAGPLHEKPSYKGGPYSHGFSANPYQFGMMTVMDEGGPEICITWSAFDIENQAVRNEKGEVLEYNFCVGLD